MFTVLHLTTIKSLDILEVWHCIWFLFCEVVLFQPKQTFISSRYV